MIGALTTLRGDDGDGRMWRKKFLSYNRRRERLVLKIKNIYLCKQSH